MLCVGRVHHGTRGLRDTYDGCSTRTRYLQNTREKKTRAEFGILALRSARLAMRPQRTPRMLALVAMGTFSAHGKPIAALVPFWSEAKAASIGCVGVTCDDGSHHMGDGHNHKHTIDDGQEHAPPTAKLGSATEDRGNGPVQAFNMVLIDNCTKCGGDWCKSTPSGERDCVSFTFNDSLHTSGGTDHRVTIDEVGCAALVSATPYCLEAGAELYAVSKHLPAEYTAAPSVPEVRWPKIGELNDMYEHGKPSNSLSEVGLVVHCVDNTERQGAPWLPCASGVCSQFSKWWSGSVISRSLPVTFGGKGIILHPEHNQLLCAYPWDEGTMTKGCGVERNRYMPDELELMMNTTFASAYNEVLIDSPKLIGNQSAAIAAFVYGFDDNSPGGDSEWAHWAYSTFLRTYGLEKAHNRPLLLQVDKSAAPGHYFRDMSEGAREYMEKNPVMRNSPKKWKGHKFRPGAKAPDPVLRANREDQSRRSPADLRRRQQQQQEQRQWEQTWAKQEEQEQEQEQWERKRNGTSWHVPKSPSDCELGAFGEPVNCQYTGQEPLTPKL